jgi:hypothetical protein
MQLLYGILGSHMNSIMLIRTPEFSRVFALAAARELQLAVCEL